MKKGKIVLTKKKKPTIKLTKKSTKIKLTPKLRAPAKSAKYLA